MAEALKILLVTHAPKNDRTAVYHAAILRANYARSIGWEAEVLCPGDLWLSARAGRFMPMIYPIETALWMLCGKKRFDLVVFHSYSGWVFNLIKRFFFRQGPAVITSFHGVEELYFKELKKEAEISGKELSPAFQFFYFKLMNEWIRLSCRLSDKVFCLNPEEKDFLIREGYVPGSDLAAIHNDVAPDFFTQRNYAEKVKVILYAGQWLPMKGTRYLVEAFESIARECPEIELHLAGTLAAEAQVLRDFSVFARERVKVIPSLPHEKMLECYGTADLLIFPSLYEAFGRVAAEAMAAGLPIVSTRVGIGLEIFEDKKNCMVIPRRDAAAIVSAVKVLRGDFALRKKIGQAAKVSIEPFRTEIVLKQIFDKFLCTVKESRLRYERK